MELRHLRYFVAVAEELHISRAAERLHVAQPAVSEQIRKLERDLGVELLDRTRRPIALTDAGAAFLAEARRVLEGAQLHAWRPAVRRGGRRAGCGSAMRPPRCRRSCRGRCSAWRRACRVWRPACTKRRRWS